ncbi:legumain-like [Dermacentor variabilis]|uniref:legumain-like n=1 Tax=Dermacentor variabilis TaxID=34621 RepID=UPI003F5C2466
MALSRYLFLALVAVASTVAAAPKKPASTKHDGNSEPKLWALLVAGSNEYYNYRHQADICHAYHVLRNHGIPDERIVVMMYDDIANATENPTPGIIINHPKGKDVYAGVPKDYTGDLVTPQNFLDILQGKKVKGGSGKVIASGPNDHVFVNFADHGAPGLIAFPNDELHARPFVNVIKSMHKQKKFAKMVIYIEACESGSMFDGLLPNNMNVYATTAANPDESSYACYWDDKRQAYLGDLYSVNWMEDSDKEDLHKETLIDQFRIVREETNTSHVMEYGDLNIGKLPVGEFQGEEDAKPIVLPKVPYDAVSSRDVPIAVLRKKLAKASDAQTKRSLKHKLQQALRNRSFLKEKVAEIASFLAQGNEDSTESVLVAKRRLTKFDCYEHTVRYFNDRCFKLAKNPYALEQLRVFVNMCESAYKLSEIFEAMDLACTHPTVVGIV